MDITPSTPPSDKREALKWYNRRAIVVAAAALARERGLSGFTVNDLAKEAGVSRRTIFNHFSGTEDAVLGSFTDSVSGLYGDFNDLIGARRFPDLSAALDAFADAAAQLDVIGTVCQAVFPFLPNTLTEASAPDSPTCVPRRPRKLPAEGSDELGLVALRATDSVNREIVGLLNNRVDDVDPFEAHLLGEYLITTMTVCVDRWFAATGGDLTDQTRKLWQDLLSHAMDSLRRGFGP